MPHQLPRAASDIDAPLHEPGRMGQPPSRITSVRAADPCDQVHVAEHRCPMRPSAAGAAWSVHPLVIDGDELMRRS